MFQPLTSEDPGRIGRFLIRARLGAGGMGRVYLAATESGRPVAVKVMHAAFGLDPEFRERFRQEVEAARRVHGFYTAQVLDADPDAPQPWLATVYIAAPSLHEVVEEHGALPEASVLLLMAGISEALQEIHAAGIVHRDLKPSNVLLSADGPRVIDFGIARLAETRTLTGHGLVGTPVYMAPEQILGGPITPMLDVFALGTTAAFAAQGHAPFDGEGMAVLHQVVNQPAALGGCPPRALAIIERCLDKDPARRPTPGEIIAYCQRSAADQAPEPGRSWLPAAVAATVTERASAPMLPTPLPPAVGQTQPQPVPSAQRDPMSPPRTRRKTAAGLAAAAVALVAVTAAVIHLLPHGSRNVPDTAAEHSSPATQHTPTTTRSTPVPESAHVGAGAAVSAASTSLSSPSTPWYAGTWTGTVNQPTGTVTEWTVVITLPASGGTGTFASPSLDCSGSLEITSNTPGWLTLKDDLTVNPRQVCVNAVMTLTAADGNHASLAWQDAGHAQNVGTSPLARS